MKALKNPHEAYKQIATFFCLLFEIGTSKMGLVDESEHWSGFKTMVANPAKFILDLQSLDLADMETNRELARRGSLMFSKQNKHFRLSQMLQYNPQLLPLQTFARSVQRLMVLKQVQEDKPDVFEQLVE